MYKIVGNVGTFHVHLSHLFPKNFHVALPLPDRKHNYHSLHCYEIITDSETIIQGFNARKWFYFQFMNTQN